MEKVIEMLEEIKPGVDFLKEDNLIDDGILTSFDIVSVISAIDTNFDVEVGVNDIVPENFKSAKTIYEMVNKLSEE